MRNAKLWSVLLAAVLLCACVAGVLFTGASASGTPTTLYVDGVGEGENYVSVEAALAAAEEMKWGQDDKLEIVIEATATQTATVVEGVLFGQKTIWRTLDANGEETVYGNKLPITITGGTLDIDTSATTAACANDYTFTGITLPWADNSLKFFAGSGDISFDGITFSGATALYIHADNNTANVFEGWTDHLSSVLTLEEGEDQETMSFSVTFGKDTEYKTGTAVRVASKGSSTAWTYTAGDKTVSASDTKAIIVLESGSALGRVSACVASGTNTFVDEMVVDFQKGATLTNGVYGIKDRASTDGDMTLYLAGKVSAGGVFARAIDSANTASALNGDLHVVIDDGAQVAASTTIFQLCWQKCTVNGDVLLEVKGCNFPDSIIYGGMGSGGTCTGTFEQKISGGTMAGFYGSQGHAVAEMKNTITGGSIGTYYASASGGDLANISQIKKITTIVKDDGILDGNVDGATITTFYGGSYRYGAADSVIENDISGSCSIGTFYGGCGSSTSPVAGSISNTISGGTFTGTYYGGSYTGTVGHIRNLIKDGSFNAAADSSHYTAFFGNRSGTITGGIETEIQGGTFAAYTFGGSRTCTTISNSTDGEPAIKTVIKDGTFHGFWGANGSNNDVITGEILNIVEGGEFKGYTSGKTFYARSFAGGNRNGGNGGADITNEISGGTFDCMFVSGDFPHSTGSDFVYTGDGLKGTINTTITGGVFGGKVYTNSYVDSETTLYPTATLTITETTGEELAIYGEVADCTSFNGNGGTVKIGKDTVINAAAATGRVTFEQTEGWLAHDYFKALNSEIDVTVEEAAGIFGAYDDSQETLALVLVKGKSQSFVGATMILTDRLSVRFLFDQVEVASYGDEFTFTAKMGDETLATESGTYTASDGKTYASVIVKSIGLGEFMTNFTVSGATFEEDTWTVVELAKLGVSSYAEGSASQILFKSIVNLGMVAADATATPEYELSAADVPEHVTNLFRLKEGTIVFDSKALLMSDAVGIRLYGTAAAGVVTKESIVVNVNGKDVTGYCVIDEPETGIFTVDMYVTASMMTSPLNIVITDAATKETTYLSYTEKLDSFAERCSEGGNALATQLLIFIQAANAYKNA